MQPIGAAGAGAGGDEIENACSEESHLAKPCHVDMFGIPYWAE